MRSDKHIFRHSSETEGYPLHSISISFNFKFVFVSNSTICYNPFKSSAEVVVPSLIATETIRIYLKSTSYFSASESSIELLSINFIGSDSRESRSMKDKGFSAAKSITFIFSISYD